MSHKKDINWKEKQEIGKLFSGLKRNLKIERMWNGDHTTINKEIKKHWWSRNKNATESILEQ